MTILVEVFLGAALLLVLEALRRLPGTANRIVAVDLLSVCALAACVVAAARSGHTAFLDVALGFALVAFLATVCWAFALRAGMPEEDGP
ncbi:monovalent cation/H+ antiporter complex subunit F [Massilia sp. GCM10020059]|uniref:MrpF/PhaF family protein n=1 Tax=Massilia agrisoli TaxID=2892444 RepID=A0ABS8IXM2_9BURK|nr:MrpF/PhaF family protein [Massilia agrisoli]MCC6071944.1 MrpF/PhaF family protein [Massilia agrisoli]